jgi:hypothetical protein
MPHGQSGRRNSQVGSSRRVRAAQTSSPPRARSAIPRRAIRRGHNHCEAGIERPVADRADPSREVRRRGRPGARRRREPICEQLDKRVARASAHTPSASVVPGVGISMPSLRERRELIRGDGVTPSSRASRLSIPIDAMGFTKADLLGSCRPIEGGRRYRVKSGGGNPRNAVYDLAELRNGFRHCAREPRFGVEAAPAYGSSHGRRPAEAAAPSAAVLTVRFPAAGSAGLETVACSETGRWLCREPGDEWRKCEHWAIDAVLEERRGRAVRAR